MRKVLKLSKYIKTGGVLVKLFSKIDFTASKPDFLLILGNMLVILEVTKIGFVGKTMLIILSIISSRWLLSLNLDDILSDNSHKTGPISTDNFSIAVSQPLVTALTELFIL